MVLEGLALDHALMSISGIIHAPSVTTDDFVERQRGTFFSQTSFASDFGGLGLIKIPTARMAGDGELRATISREDVADIYNIAIRRSLVRGNF